MAARGRTVLKRTWIRPVLVNAALYTGDLANAAVTYHADETPPATTVQALPDATVPDVSGRDDPASADRVA